MLLALYILCEVNSYKPPNIKRQLPQILISILKKFVQSELSSTSTLHFYFVRDKSWTVTANKSKQLMSRPDCCELVVYVSFFFVYMCVYFWPVDVCWESADRLNVQLSPTFRGFFFCCDFGILKCLIPFLKMFASKAEPRLNEASEIKIFRGKYWKACLFMLENPSSDAFYREKTDMKNEQQGRRANCCLALECKILAYDECV